MESILKDFEGLGECDDLGEQVEGLVRQAATGVFKLAVVGMEIDGWKNEQASDQPLPYGTRASMDMGMGMGIGHGYRCGIE